MKSGLRFNKHGFFEASLSKIETLTILEVCLDFIHTGQRRP